MTKHTLVYMKNLDRAVRIHCANELSRRGGGFGDRSASTRCKARRKFLAHGSLRRGRWPQTSYAHLPRRDFGPLRP